MARFLNKVFAGNSANSGQFGSFSAGTKVLSDDPATLSALPAYEQGWSAATDSFLKIPRGEEMEGVQRVISAGLVQQWKDGITFWQANMPVTQYQTIVQYQTGTELPKLYVNITGTNGASTPDTDQTNWKELSFGGAHVVGEIVSVFGTSDYVPFGCVLADGMEYTKALFPTVWNDYLTAATPLLPICTYSEYAADITAYGQCAKFAVDTVNEKFKVPTVKNKLINDLTGIPVVGNGMTLGLTNGTQNGGFSSYFNGNIAQAGTWTGAYGTSVGTTQAGDLIGGTKGVTTDPTKSGIETTAGDNSNGVEVRFFVCLAGGVINESMMDWQNYMTALAGKADIDLSNVTAAGKDVMAGMGMPSSQSVDLTLGASGEAYTAPANGYFTYISRGLTYLDMFIDVNGAGIITRATDVSTYVRSFTPARAGEKMTLSYVGTPTGAIFRFYYAEGSK